MATVLSILLLISLISYLTLIRPIWIETSKIKDKLLNKRLEEEKICIQMKEVRKMEHGFNLECIEI